jgi:hypothetical protein
VSSSTTTSARCSPESVPAPTAELDGPGILQRVTAGTTRWAGACLSVLALTACTGVTDLTAAGTTCTKTVDKAIAGMGDQFTAGDFVTIGADGGSVSVSSPVKGENGAIVSAVAVGCLLRETKAPYAVRTALEDVTTQDGRQEVSWSDLTMSYALDPDFGLSAVVTTR